MTNYYFIETIDARMTLYLIPTVNWQMALYYLLTGELEQREVNLVTSRWMTTEGKYT